MEQKRKKVSKGLVFLFSCFFGGDEENTHETFSMNDQMKLRRTKSNLILFARFVVLFEFCNFYKYFSPAGSLGSALAGDSGGSASSWVLKTKKLDILKRLDEQDEEFCKTEGFAPVAYKEDDVKGLTVLHDVNDLAVGEQIELTLADTNVLDEGEQKLISKELQERQRQKEMERYKKNKGKPVYDVYDHDAPVLGQYDEEQSKSFVLGKADPVAEERMEEMRKKAAADAKRLLYDASNAGGEVKIASDYLTRDEMKGKKKKKKKKEKEKRGKRRRKDMSDLMSDLPEEDEEEEEEDRASKSKVKERRLQKTEEGRKQELLEKEMRYKKALKNAMLATKEKLYEEKGDKEEEDEEMLAKVIVPRTVVKREETGMSVAEKLALRARQKKEKKANEESHNAGLTFSSTTEFLKAVKVEDEAEEEKREVKREDKREDKREERGEERGVLKDEAMMEEGELPYYPPEEEEQQRFVQEEPTVGSGMAATLQYLRMRGMDGREDVVARPTDGSVGKRRKAYDEDDEEDQDRDPRFRVDLQKYDEFGRPLSRKEAYRVQAQSFHGNYAGPMAQERRLRSFLREQKMKEKLSTEATLRDLDKVEKRQKELGQAGLKLTMDTAEIEELQDAATRAVKKKIRKKLK